MMSNREFLEGCIDCIIDKELESNLIERLNAKTREDMWLELNHHGYFVKHYQDANGDYFQIIERMSTGAKRRYKKLMNELEQNTNIVFGKNLKILGGK